VKEARVRTKSRRSVHTAIALAVIHLGACAAVLPAFFSWSGVLAGFGLYYLTGGLGICLAYHRLLTHRSIALPRPLEYAVATLGVLAMQGGPIAWVATHRAHHAFSDTERDPHNSRRGFRWCHMEWLYRRNPARLTREQEGRFAADLATDPYYRFLETTAAGWQVALALVLFFIGGWSWVVWGIFLRLVVTYHATWLVNSASHMTGYRTFRTPGRDRSTNNWWVALLAWGEGWHNNHHAFPFSARHGLRWFEFDVTWWTINALAFLRLAADVRLPSAEMLHRRTLAFAPEPHLRPEPRLNVR
jgi:stearoyl-CoA desaturase (delta-9 desaturase)